MPTVDDWTAVRQQVEFLTTGLQRQATLTQAAATATPRHDGPKPTKPDTFSSTRDSGSPQAWLFSQRLYFEATGTADQHKVSFAVTFLRGSAALWWQSHLAQVDSGTALRLTSWDNFSTEFQA